MTNLIVNVLVFVALTASAIGVIGAIFYAGRLYERREDREFWDGVDRAEVPPGERGDNWPAIRRYLVEEGVPEFDALAEEDSSEEVWVAEYARDHVLVDNPTPHLPGDEHLVLVEREQRRGALSRWGK